MGCRVSFVHVLILGLLWFLQPQLAIGSALVQTFTVDCGVRCQTMDNFGANDAWTMQNIGGWPEPVKSHVADLLFSTNNGIGLSCWRFYCAAGINHRTIQDSWRTDESFALEPGRYDWSREAGERWFLRAAKARGVRQFIATFYSPPPWLTRNGLSNLGGDTHSTTNLKLGAEEAYAHYITDILVHFRDDPDERERIEFDYVVPANEPQWDWQDAQEGNRASNEDLRRIYVALAGCLRQAGLKTKILGPESGCLPDMTSLDAGAVAKWHADYGDYLHLICGDPAVSDGFGGVVSYHSYWSDRIPDRLEPERRRLGQAMQNHPGWKIWQSEYCIMEAGRDLTMDMALRVALIINSDLTLANASAWQWWLAVANEDFKSGLIYTDYRNPGDSEDILESKTLWVLGNFSKFIRPGMVRVQLSGRQNATKLVASAFTDINSGRTVLVFVNSSSQPQPVKIQFRSSAGKTIWLTPYTTSAQDNLAKSGKIPATESFSILPRSVVTLLGEGTSTK